MMMSKQQHFLVLTLALAGLACQGSSRGGSGGSGSGGAIGSGGGSGGTIGSSGAIGSGGAIGNGGIAGSGGIGVDGGVSTGTGGVGAAGGSTNTAIPTGGSGGVTTGVGGSPPSGPYPSKACTDRANTLLGQMTADEKFAQMLQMERAALTTQQVTQYGVGSGFSQGGSAPSTNSPAGWADMADGYRQAALASRLKIPFLYGADEVHGIGTVKGAVVFPHNIGLGATRDNALIAEIATITARESLGCGVDFVFSPVVAVALNERWGRTYEAFGETTELASTMGTIMVKGLQFTSTGAATGILANAKHYLGDGGTADGVNAGTVEGDETALRAIHLEPYRATVTARVGSIMASYNTWQGTKMHVNKTMLTDVLKGELAFGGFVISDFDACLKLGSSTQDGLGQCLNAGVDMFMTFSKSLSNMLGYFAALLKDGTITQARVDDAVRRIVAVKCELGLFEASGKVDRALTDEVGSAAHRQIARKAVQKSLVLLKNDGAVLPLAKTATVALGGKSADNTGNQCGGWTISWQGSSGNNVTGATSVRQAFEAVLGASQVKYSDDGKSTSGASVGVAVIGETPYAEGKGDSKDLTVSSSDVSVVKAMKDAGLKTVVVLIAGRPMILDPLMSYADAVVVAWLPGSEGAGITDILFGDAKPSGKLPHSWPRSMSQLPINYGDASYDPLYAYGFGLSY